MSDVDIGDRPRPLLDGVEPVLHVVIADRQTHWQVIRRSLCQVGGIAADFVIADPDLPQFSDEFSAGRRTVVFQPNDNPVGVPHPYAPPLAHQAVTSFAAFRLGVDDRLELAPFTPDFHRTGVVHIERPLDLIETVGSGTRHFSARIGSQRDPSEVGALDEDVGVKTDRFGHAAPGVPVEFFRDGLRLESALPRAWIVADHDRMDLAGQAVAHQLATPTMPIHGPSMGPRLQDARVLADGIDQEASFADRQ